MEAETGSAFQQALRLALRERRLWPAGLLVAAGFADCWRIIFDWGPQKAGEEAANWVRGGSSSGAADIAVMVLVALAIFVLLRLLGYTGEMVLIGQAAGAARGESTSIMVIYARYRERYLSLGAILLPWDALRLTVIYVTYPFVFLWQQWDPRPRFFLPYLLIFLAWFILLVVVSVPLGITVLMAERQAILAGSPVPEAWRKGWRIFRANATRCCAAWLQVLAVDVIFIIVGWLLAALLPWAATRLASALSMEAQRWILRTAAYLILAALLLPGQMLVQCFKSSLWTMIFLELSAEGRERGRQEDVRQQNGTYGDREEMFYPPLTRLPMPPPGSAP